MDDIMTMQEAAGMEMPIQQSPWHDQPMSLDDVRNHITANYLTIKRSFIAIGFYLKKADQNSLYLDAGYSSVWDFAHEEYGLDKSRASRYMSINTKFSVDGNSPILQERYKAFNKSQMQEMLYLEDNQLEQVTPDMRVQDIRDIRQPKEKTYSIPYFELDGQMEFGADFPEVMPEQPEQIQAPMPQAQSFVINVSDLLPEEPVAISQQPEPQMTEAQQPLSAYGTPNLAHPEDSLVAMKLELGEPEPAEEKLPPSSEKWSLGELPQAKEKHLKQLAKKLVERLGSKIVLDEMSSIPSEEAIEKATRQLDRMELGGIELQEGAVAYASQGIIEFFQGEEDLGVCSYARFVTQARKALSEWSDQAPREDQEEDEQKPEVIDAEFSKVEEAEDEELTDLQIARQELERAQNLLGKCLKDLPDENNIYIRGMKIKVAALASLVCDMDAIENPPEPSVQPELPLLKNNDQRAAFVDAYETWPLWIETAETGERYYRYDLQDGTSMVVKVYHAMLFDYGKMDCSWKERYTEGYGRQEYYLLKPGKFFRDCDVNRSTLIDKLKEIQKKG